MSARSLFQRAVAAKCHQSFHLQPGQTFEVWTTSCIVTNFPGNDILVNPCNSDLSGVSKFPYFPRGGPVPPKPPTTMHKDWQPLGYISSWGNMDVKNGIVFPHSVVDGLVHEHGGWRLRLECQWKAPCPVGTSVRTSAGALRDYSCVLHTTPPFFRGRCDETLLLLQSCYHSVLDSATKSGVHDVPRVAIPLLGAGARGFEPAEAIEVAVSSCVNWFVQNPTKRAILVFGLLERGNAELLVQDISRITG